MTTRYNWIPCEFHQGFRCAAQLVRPEGSKTEPPWEEGSDRFADYFSTCDLLYDVVRCGTGLVFVGVIGRHTDPIWKTSSRPSAVRSPSSKCLKIADGSQKLGQSSIALVKKKRQRYFKPANKT